MTGRRLSLLTVALTLPIALTALGVVAALALLPGAADPLAVHWGLSGAADGFAASGTVPVGMLAFGLGLPLLLGLVLLLAPPVGGRPSPFHKLLAALALALAALAAVVGVWMLATQRTDGSPPAIWSGLALGLVAALAAGLLGWFALPPAVRRRGAVREPAPVELASTERAAWLGQARLGAAGIVAIVAGILVALVAAGAATLATRGAAWPILLVPAVLLLLLLATVVFTVRVDERGLVVRGAAGMPVWRIAPGEVESAGIGRVDPMADFGGWGVRYAPGRRTGIVLRAGEALEVRRRDGRTLVVTLDDAGAAAALLSAYAARATPARP